MERLIMHANEDEIASMFDPPPIFRNIAFPMDSVRSTRTFIPHYIRCVYPTIKLIFRTLMAQLLQMP